MIKLKHLLIEGRYDSITTQLSRELLDAIKTKTKQGELQFQFPTKTAISIDGLSDLEFSPEINLLYKIKYNSKFKMGFDVYGQADDESIELAMTINPTYVPKIYSEIVPILKDAIRHELEHVAQNLLNRPDSEKYERIPPGDFVKYLTAKHEVPAFVRGLYKQAKTRRIPLSQMFDLFFMDYTKRINKQDAEYVKNIWIDYAKRNLPKAQFI